MLWFVYMIQIHKIVFSFRAHRMISAWDTFFEVDDYYTYKKPVGHGAYGVVISALDTRDNSKVCAIQ